MKTIKDIAYNCADTLNYENKEMRDKYKLYKKAGDFWGDIQIDENLAKNLSIKIDTDITENQDTFVACFANLNNAVQLYRVPLMACGPVSAYEWLYLEDNNGILWGCDAYSLDKDCYNVYTERRKGSKYVNLIDEDHNLSVRAKRVVFSNPITLKERTRGHLLQDDLIGAVLHYDSYRFLLLILKRALKVDGILSNSQKKYIKEALKATRLKDEELRLCNFAFVKQALAEIENEMKNYKDIIQTDF